MEDGATNVYAEMSLADDETRELIEKVAREFSSNARAEVVFGDPVERDGVTLIPVASAAVGLGGGGRRGGERDPGGVMGAGLRVSPVGYIEARDGQVRFRRILPNWALVTVSLGIGALAALALASLRRLR